MSLARFTRRHTVAVSLLLLCPTIAIAQSQPAALVVTEAEAREHLLAPINPVYPAIARAARVQGDIVLQVVIDPSGKVKSEKVVSGPPMLQTAARQAVAVAKFKVFESHSAPVIAITTLTIPFKLAGRPPTSEQEAASQAYFPLADKCRSALKQQDAKDASDLCKQALEKSQQAGDSTSSDQLAMLEAYQSYGHALLLAGQTQDAVVAENKAVDLAKAFLKDTDQEYAMPFYWRAFAEARLNESDAASADLTVAEDTLRKAIAHLPEMKKMYSGYLSSILKQHATLLDAMGKPEEAAKLRADAGALE